MQAAALEQDRAEWLEDAVATIAALANEQPEITADDLRKHIRPPAHPNWPGVAFSAARNLGYIESVNTTTSKAKSRNHGSLKVWAAIKEES